MINDFILSQDQTVVTVGVSDLEVIETSKDDISLKFLGITQSHNQVRLFPLFVSLTFQMLTFSYRAQISRHVLS